MGDWKTAVHCAIKDENQVATLYRRVGERVMFQSDLKSKRVNFTGVWYMDRVLLWQRV